MKIQTEKPDAKTTILKCGHAIVRISKLDRGPYTTHRLAWKVGKKTFRRSYNSEASALAEADRIVRHLATCDGSVTALSGQDVSYFNECKERLGSTPMHVAVEFYLKFHERTNPQTFSEVWNLWYAKAEERQLSSRYYQTLRNHRNAWEPEFGKRFIDTIAPEEYLAFLSKSKYSPKSMRNLFGTLSSLLRWAAKKNQRFISKDKTEMETNFPSEKEVTPEFYTPDELCAIFAATEPRFLAYTALMAFGGTRRSEASSRKLTRKNILFAERMIRLGPEITKTGTGRALNIPDNLQVWLDRFAPEKGPIAKIIKITPPDEAVLKLCGVEDSSGGCAKKKPKFTKDNALRHSFCSYHIALHRNSELTSEVAGNSVDMLKKHYKALVSTVAAEQWFNITPDVVRQFAKKKGIALAW
jgi:hypothetical protein